MHFSTVIIRMKLLFLLISSSFSIAAGVSAAAVGAYVDKDDITKDVLVNGFLGGIVKASMVEVVFHLTLPYLTRWCRSRFAIFISYLLLSIVWAMAVVITIVAVLSTRVIGLSMSLDVLGLNDS
jgi:hypothetical protein